jgi:aquaporin Z/aquaporin NIP
VGAALAVGVLIAGPVTGGAVNPVRALGPALVSGQFTQLWVYLVGPLLGGVLAALLYDCVLAKGDAPS